MEFEDHKISNGEGEKYDQYEDFKLCLLSFNFCTSTLRGGVGE